VVRACAGRPKWVLELFTVRDRVRDISRQTGKMSSEDKKVKKKGWQPKRADWRAGASAEVRQYTNAIARPAWSAPRRLPYR